MTADPDDEALSWGDESDPTYVESGNPVRDERRRGHAERTAATGVSRGNATGETPTGATDGVNPLRPSASGGTAAPDGEVLADDGAPEASTSSAMLLALGILAGAYLLYTAGWFTSAVRNIAVPVGAFDVLMYQLREWFSVAAPALWFSATLLLTRTRTPSIRLLWLVLGAIVLIPVPFVLGE